MQMHCSHTAILIFARSAQDEVAHKSFFRPAGYRVNLAIARLLNQKIERSAAQTGLPTFVVDSRQQTGPDFGSRFTRAIASVFARGFQRVIAVGNDCLSLDHTQILAAEKSLDQHTLVLGPTTDGGTYLIGIDRSLFDADAFAQLPWQKATLYQALLQWGQQRGARSNCLALAQDIDNSDDFIKALRALCQGHLRTYLLHLIGWQHNPLIDRAPAWSTTTLLPTTYLRGPPVYTH